jgi:hypothetical protein
MAREKIRGTTSRDRTGAEWSEPSGAMALKAVALDAWGQTR